MGARKKIAADKLKERKSTTAIAHLNNCPISARKMRLVADIVRGVEVNKALNILQHNSKEAAGRLEKLLRSAIANWEQKNQGKNIEEETLVVSEIKVNQAGMLKRISAAPQGRAHRIRKRSNHTTIIVDSKK
ncbi:MAG: 50S ribosomal protein L22 [Crocinitomicaceae bacterium]|jgi:large subunit ribosomal protein L22|nr:50S ribosomal protein L22 [Crocinitomicaceae bacterium]